MKFSRMISLILVPAAGISSETSSILLDNLGCVSPSALVFRRCEILTFSSRFSRSRDGGGASSVRKRLYRNKGSLDALVLAAKVFLVREKTELGVLAGKLKTFKVKQETSGEEVDFSLTTEVKDLSVSRSILEGTFSFDDVFVVKHRGKVVPIPRTYE